MIKCILEPAVAWLCVAGLMAWGSSVASAQTRVDWPVYGFDISHDGYNPAETILSPANVGSLVTKWTFKFVGSGIGNGFLPQPLLAAQVPVAGVPTDLLLVGGNANIFYALDANSKNPNGTVIWSVTLPSKTTCTGGTGRVRITGTAVIDRDAVTGGGSVYVGFRGDVFAFDLATGATKSGWPKAGVDIPNKVSLSTDASIHGGLTLLNGMLYVPASGGCADRPPYHGKLTLIDTASASVVNQWFSLTGNGTVPNISGGGIWGVGGVSIDPTPVTGGVYAGTGNPLPNPTSNTTPPPGYSEAVVQISPDLGQTMAYDQPQPWKNDNDVGMTPILFRPASCPGIMVAAGKKTGAFAIYQAGLTHRQLLTMNSATLTVESIGAAAFDGGTQTLLVSNPGVNSSFPRGLLGLQADTNCQFGLGWSTNLDLNGVPIFTQDTAISSPTAANGVAYFGVSPPAVTRLYAVGESGSNAGQVLWQSSDIYGAIQTAPAVVNGQVYVLSSDGTVHAYGLP